MVLTPEEEAVLKELKVRRMSRDGITEVITTKAATIIERLVKILEEKNG